MIKEEVKRMGKLKATQQNILEAMVEQLDG
jgi:hypothetical protein